MSIIYKKPKIVRIFGILIRNISKLTYIIHEWPWCNKYVAWEQLLADAVRTDLRRAVSLRRASATSMRSSRSRHRSVGDLPHSDTREVILPHTTLHCACTEVFAVRCLILLSFIIVALTRLYLLYEIFKIWFCDFGYLLNFLCKCI